MAKKGMLLRTMWWRCARNSIVWLASSVLLALMISISVVHREVYHTVVPRHAGYQYGVIGGGLVEADQEPTAMSAFAGRESVLEAVVVSPPTEHGVSLAALELTRLMHFIGTVETARLAARAKRREMYLRSFEAIHAIRDASSCASNGGQQETYNLCGATHYCCGPCSGNKVCQSYQGWQLDGCACVLDTPIEVAMPLPVVVARCTTRTPTSDGPRWLSVQPFSSTPRGFVACDSRPLHQPQPARDPLVVFTSTLPGRHTVDHLSRSNSLFSARVHGYGPLLDIGAPTLGESRTVGNLGRALALLQPDTVVLLLDAVQGSSESRPDGVTVMDSLVIRSAQNLRDSFTTFRGCGANGTAVCDVVIAAGMICTPRGRSAAECSGTVDSSHAQNRYMYIEPSGIIGTAGALQTLFQCAQAGLNRNHDADAVAALAACYGEDGQQTIALDVDSLLFATVPPSESVFPLEWEWYHQDGAPILVRKGRRSRPAVALFPWLGFKDDRKKRQTFDACQRFQAVVYNKLGGSINSKPVALRETSSERHPRVVVVIFVPRKDSTCTLLALRAIAQQTLLPDAVHIISMKINESTAEPGNESSFAVTIHHISENHGPTSFLPILEDEVDGATLLITVACGKAIGPNWVRDLVHAHFRDPTVAYAFGGHMVDMTTCSSGDALDTGTLRVRSAGEWRDRPVSVDVLGLVDGALFVRNFFNASMLKSVPNACVHSLDIFLSAHLAHKGIPRIMLPRAPGTTFGEPAPRLWISDPDSVDHCARDMIHAFMLSRRPEQQMCAVQFQPIATPQPRRGAMMNPSAYSDHGVSPCGSTPDQTSKRLLPPNKSIDLLARGYFLSANDVLVSPSKTATARLSTRHGSICVTVHNSTAQTCFPQDLQTGDRQNDTVYAELQLNSNFCVRRGASPRDDRGSIGCSGIQGTAVDDVSLAVTDLGDLQVIGGDGVVLWSLNHEIWRKGARVDTHSGGVCDIVDSPCMTINASAHRVFDTLCEIMSAHPLTPSTALMLNRTSRWLDWMRPQSRPAAPPLPTLVHTVSLDVGSSPRARSNMIMAQGFHLTHYNTSTALAYVARHCAPCTDVFRLVPPRSQAAIFGLCVLFIEGGVYIDHDVHLVAPIDEAISRTAQLTVGAAFAPKGSIPPISMGVVSAVPGCWILRCALHWLSHRIDSAPAALALCVDECRRANNCSVGGTLHNSVAITYRDTRHAGWPYTGLVGLGLNRHPKLIGVVDVGSALPSALPRASAHADHCRVSDSPCLRVNLHDFHEPSCSRFGNLPLIKPSCRENQNRVPKIYHAIGRDEQPPFVVKSNAMRNHGYRLNYHNDTSGHQYVSDNCGPAVAEAFRCFIPAAYRADLFRFCALVAEGGVYLDGDILLLAPMAAVHSPCADATIGHDYPQGPHVPDRSVGYQMKLLAALPKSPLFHCMLSRIVQNVRQRFELGGATLTVTGPGLLAACVEQCTASGGRCVGSSPRNTTIAITYRDTRQAAGPFAGLLGTDSKGHDRLLAFEMPSQHHFREGSEEHYSTVRSSIYREDCSLLP